MLDVLSNQPLSPLSFLSPRKYSGAAPRLQAQKTPICMDGRVQIVPFCPSQPSDVVTVYGFAGTGSTTSGADAKGWMPNLG
jgi:hypothetical protein